MAGAAGQSIEHDGPCGSDSAGGTACTDSSECAAEEYCELDSCGGSGSCVERPQVCLALYDPVCGCDGQTYSNGCVASSYGQTVAAGGECPEGGDTGDDGATELSCDELEEQFNAENQAVRGCTEDAECGQPIPGTSCGCTRDLVGRADANFDRWTDLIAQARAQDCSWAWLYGGISTCDCPPADGFICGEAGFCQWNYQ
jgi:hypothetical protein